MRDIVLQKCKRTDPQYQSIRDRHYVENRGCHGQQMHYLVLVDGNVVGIISGASAVYAVKARDEFFSLTKENRQIGLNSIINNVVFRLELHEPNLGTQTLALWRRTVAKDWEERYKVQVHGFETFIVEETYRKGSMYKADNWVFVGETAGNTKAHGKGGLTEKFSRVKTDKKLIFVKKIPKTKLCESYTSTWRGKK